MGKMSFVAQQRQFLLSIFVLFWKSFVLFCFLWLSSGHVFLILNIWTFSGKTGGQWRAWSVTEGRQAAEDTAGLRARVGVSSLPGVGLGGLSGTGCFPAAGLAAPSSCTSQLSPATVFSSSVVSVLMPKGGTGNTQAEFTPEVTEEEPVFCFGFQTAHFYSKPILPFSLQQMCDHLLGTKPAASFLLQAVRRPLAPGASHTGHGKVAEE